MNVIKRYMHWLHTQWPAGHVEELPVLDEEGRTNIPGVFVAGDLKGVPLLKFAADSGARVVRMIVQDKEFQQLRQKEKEALDLLIIGGGVAGMSAALEARAQGLSFKILEASEPFSTIVNFPKAKPIFTYPNEMEPTGHLKVTADVKEALVEELRRQTVEQGIQTTPLFVEKIQRKGGHLEVVVKDYLPLIARRVLVAIGRSGNFRKLNAPGEELDKVYNRLHDPKDFAGKNVLVVGGGDSAMETAIALTFAGAAVTLSYRQKQLSRAKPENIERVMTLARDPMAPVAVENPVSERVTTAVDTFMGERRKGGLRLLLGSTVQEIRPDTVLLKDGQGQLQTLPNDIVFAMIGREAPLNFFRRSGIRISGEWTRGRVLACAAFVLFCAALFNWKSGGFLSDLFYRRGWFPTHLPQLFAGWAARPGTTSYQPGQAPYEVDGARPDTLLGTLALSAQGPAFWYTLAYSAVVVLFGLKRIRRRKTPYVRLQTLTLMAIQVFPLFLLPEVLLPWLGHNDWIPRVIADNLFPVVSYGHGREYWRAYGFILAWPLMIYNVFTDQPIAWWLAISFLQTFVLIPAIIYRWGKGAYCGWLCSCGALAETLGDTHRTKMPHGPKWNRLNMAGQGILALTFLMLILRIIGWFHPHDAWINRFFSEVLERNYKWLVDVGLAGILGVGFYFWFSGRFWCRFFCPLAALMHIYARFSRFGILAEKKKCISCNVCTSVCHQGIDVMNFANKGLPMRDPQCVRCSACVQSCPTGVLSFGQVDKSGHTIQHDTLPASLVQMTQK